MYHGFDVATPCPPHASPASGVKDHEEEASIYAGEIVDPDIAFMEGGSDGDSDSTLDGSNVTIAESEKAVVQAVSRRLHASPITVPEGEAAPSSREQRGVCGSVSSQGAGSWMACTSSSPSTCVKLEQAEPSTSQLVTPARSTTSRFASSSYTAPAQLCAAGSPRSHTQSHHQHHLQHQRHYQQQQHYHHHYHHPHQLYSKSFFQADRENFNAVPMWVALPERVALHGKHVVFVDVTPDESALRSVVKCARSVTIIDHHDTASGLLGKGIISSSRVSFSNDECASTLVWEWITWRDGPARAVMGSEMPPLLPYIRANDLFRFDDVSTSDADVRSICRAMRISLQPYPSTLSHVFEMGFSYLTFLRQSIHLTDIITSLAVARMQSPGKLRYMRVPAAFVMTASSDAHARPSHDRHVTTPAGHGRVHMRAAKGDYVSGAVDAASVDSSVSKLQHKATSIADVFDASDDISGSAAVCAGSGAGVGAGASSSVGEQKMAAVHVMYPPSSSTSVVEEDKREVCAYVVNANYMIPDLADSILASRPEVDVVWIFYFHLGRDAIQVMLRSNGRFNCGAYARSHPPYTGGGHVRSAAFSIQTLLAMNCCFT